MSTVTTVGTGTYVFLKIKKPQGKSNHSKLKARYLGKIMLQVNP
jgi:hypothetical protein